MILYEGIIYKDLNEVIATENILDDDISDLVYDEIIKIVECIKSIDDVEKGYDYYVIEEDELDYLLIDDGNCEYWYRKKYFKEV